MKTIARQQLGFNIPDMSVIYFCFLYILDICLLTVNVFAPQFNVCYNYELSPIPNG